MARGGLNITSHEMICFCKLMVVGVDEFSGLGAEKAYLQRLSGCSFWAWMDSPKNVRYLEDHLRTRKWSITMVIVSPLTGVIPLINGLFMAYK